MPQINIPRGALVLVADGAKALFLRNEGSPVEPRLVVDLAFEQQDPPTRDQGTDRPGRASSTVGARRSAIEPTDWHQLGEERFAADVAKELRRITLEDPSLQIVVIAPPETLGDLRHTWSTAVGKKVVAEVAKDLTSHPISEIEKLLSHGDPP